MIAKGECTIFQAKDDRMIITARAFQRGTEDAVSERIRVCEKRGGASASLFLDTELNDALPRAKCLFFYGGKHKWKGLLSVFYPTECEAEFTVAVAEQAERVLPALLRAALKECRKWGIEECYTVVNPAMGEQTLQKAERSGVRLTYSHSEYFLCHVPETLSAAAKQPDGTGAEAAAKEMGKLPVTEAKMRRREECSIQRYETAGEPVRYCLFLGEEEAAECFLSPFDGGTGWYLYHLETKEAFRRQGLATRLISRVAREISARGAKTLRLQVSSGNVPAERLYRKLGFRTEEQRDFYRTEWVR